MIGKGNAGSEIVFDFILAMLTICLWHANSKIKQYFCAYIFAQGSTGFRVLLCMGAATFKSSLAFHLLFLRILLAKWCMNRYQEVKHTRKFQCI